jgi:hypothetical protein
VTEQDFYADGERAEGVFAALESRREPLVSTAKDVLTARGYRWERACSGLACRGFDHRPPGVPARSRIAASFALNVQPMPLEAIR